MSATKRIDAVQDRAIGRLESAQDATLEAARNLVHALKPYVPHVEVARVSSRIPEPGTLVGRAYEFAGRVLNTNRGFAEELARTLAPLAPVDLTNGSARPKNSTKTTAKSAPKNES